MGVLGTVEVMAEMALVMAYITGRLAVREDMQVTEAAALLMVMVVQVLEVLAALVALVVSQAAV